MELLEIRWLSQGYFRPKFDWESDPFVISMPLPNVTGSLHMGHAMFVTREDIMVRYHRMRGRPTLWLPGIDHAGAVIEAFIRLHEKGLIYQGSYMVNWSPKLQTAVSDLEVEYSEEPGTLYYIKYHLAGGSRSNFLTISTTRPETLFGDVAIAVHPQYVGKMAIVPMTYGHHVPIISDKVPSSSISIGKNRVFQSSCLGAISGSADSHIDRQ
ncbi:hypothetical protein Gotur_010999, partial [Gossypium turneri]